MAVKMFWTGVKTSEIIISDTGRKMNTHQYEQKRQCWSHDMNYTIQRIKENPEDWEFSGESMEDLIKRIKSQFASALFKDVGHTLVAHYFSAEVAKAKEYEFDFGTPMLMYAWDTTSRNGKTYCVRIEGETQKIMLEIADILNGKTEL